MEKELNYLSQKIDLLEGIIDKHSELTVAANRDIEMLENIIKYITLKELCEASN